MFQEADREGHYMEEPLECLEFRQTWHHLYLETSGTFSPPGNSGSTSVSRDVTPPAWKAAVKIIQQQTQGAAL